jgi:hypothetical protein
MLIWGELMAEKIVASVLKVPELSNSITITTLKLLATRTIVLLLKMPFA